MATITITVGSVTVDKTVPDDRLERVIDYAFSPDPTWTQRKKLNTGLDAMWELVRDAARDRRSAALRQQMNEQINQEV